MKTRTAVVVLGIAAHLLAPAGCGTGGPGTPRRGLAGPAVAWAAEAGPRVVTLRDEDPVATWKGGRVTRGELLALLESPSAKHGLFRNGLETTRRELLRQQVDNALAAIDAGRKNLRRDPGFLMAADPAITTWMANRYQQDVLTAEAQLTEEDLRPHTPPRWEKILVRHICTTTREEAEKVRARVLGGEDFAAVCRAESIAPYPEKGGDLGWIPRWYGSIYAKETLEPLYDLAPGAISPVLESEMGYEVFKVLERKALTPEEIEGLLANVRQNLFHEKYGKTVARFIAAQRIAVDAKAAERFARDPKAPDDLVLGTANDWKVTAGYLRAFVSEVPEKKRPSLATGGQVGEVVGSLLEQRAYRQALEKTGFASKPENVKKIETFLDAKLVDYYYQRLFRELTPTAEELRAFARAHRDEIMVPPRYRLSTILVEKRERAQKVHGLLEEGKSFESLAETYSIDAATTGKGGDIGWVYEDQLDPAYVDLVKGLPLGSYSRPVEVRGGKMWAVVRIDGREPRRVATEQEAMEMVVENVRNEKRARIYDAHFEPLRKEFGLKVDEEMVKTVIPSLAVRKPGGHKMDMMTPGGGGGGGKPANHP